MILRKLTEDDLNFLIEVRNDESTRKFLENDSEAAAKIATSFAPAVKAA